jgi:hypothetical protein
MATTSSFSHSLTAVRILGDAPSESQPRRSPCYSVHVPLRVRFAAAALRLLLASPLPTSSAYTGVCVGR